MRKIDKGAPMQDFLDFIRKTKPTDWRQTKGHSTIWREYILKIEQHGISGYTEVCLDVNSSHIDHFRTRDLFPCKEYVFDWRNFVVDSREGSYGSKYKDVHIGSKTENEMLINPVEEDARRFFQYELNGKMIPANGLTEGEHRRAQFTIDMFNLNEASLKDRRKRILLNDLGAYEGLEEDEILTYLQAEGFPSVVEQLLNERKQEEDSI